MTLFARQGIDGNRDAYITKWGDDGASPIAVSDSKLEGVHKAPEANHIRGECVGNAITLYVNGQAVLEAKDAEYGSGKVGLFVSDFGLAPGTEVSLDNFSVREF